ncbi:MAG: hypothetical protein IKA42_05930 [Clostridia bacterium]|nr:hypothetical protein [Clostridia bacterium]
MKKLSLIMAMVLIATIGGVYATWTYGGTSVGVTTREITISIQGAQQTGVKGELTITLSTGYSLLISDSGNYVPELKEEGYISIVFSPANGASEDVKANGIPVYLKTVLETQAVFTKPDSSGSIDVFEANNDSYTLLESSHLTGSYADLGYDVSAVIKNGKLVPNKEARIALSDLGMDLTDEMKSYPLNSIEKHSAMQQAIGSNVHFKIYVSETNI